MNLGYTYCSNVQNVIDCMSEKLPVDMVVRLDFKIRMMIRTGFWETLECLYLFDYTEEIGLVNWIDPDFDSK